MNIPCVRILIAATVVGIALAGAQGQSNTNPALAVDFQGNSANTLPLAGPNRPATVPDGYVVTPFGYFHRSCVQSLASGERLLADGRVQHSDGSVEENVAVCGYPRYTPAGIPVKSGTAQMSAPQMTTPGKGKTAELSGWVESESITTGSVNRSYGAMVSIWSVPTQPASNDGQTLFFFPGFEDINNTESILQPVLQWYGGQWTIASWNCCLNGITTESPVINVRSKDEIYGSITSNCPPGTLSCRTWNVLSLDISTGKSTELKATPSDGQRFNWAFSGVLEPYNLISCSDYPPNREIAFDNLTFDESLGPILKPKWSGATNTTDTPQCGYKVKAAPYQVELSY